MTINYFPQPTRFASQRRARILVVEDSDDQWFLTRWALLQRFPEVEAIRMTNTLQTIMYLEGCALEEVELPKLILLDLYLPQREDGWRLLQIIKTHHLYREIPVIMLSSSTSHEDIRESYMFRSNSYIVKPTSYEQWLDCFASLRQYWWQTTQLPINEER